MKSASFAQICQCSQPINCLTSRKHCHTQQDVSANWYKTFFIIHPEYTGTSFKEAQIRAVQTVLTKTTWNSPISAPVAGSIIIIRILVEPVSECQMGKSFKNPFQWFTLSDLERKLSKIRMLSWQARILGLIIIWMPQSHSSFLHDGKRSLFLSNLVSLTF